MAYRAAPFATLPRMQQINTCVVEGNLTRDPDINVSKGGSTYARLGIANNRREKRNGEWVDKANFFDVVVFGRTAENIAEYLSKGSPVTVVGELSYSSWETESGDKRSSVGIVAREVRFGSRRDGGRDSSDVPGDTEGLGGGSTLDNQDIPF